MAVQEATRDERVEVAPPVPMKVLRERLGISQNTLAELAGVSIGVVQKLESPGRVEPETARRLAKALRVPAAQVAELLPSLKEPGRRGIRPGENVRTVAPAKPKRTRTVGAPAAAVSA